MSFKHFITNKKTQYFLGGVATAILAPLVAKSPEMRKVVVKTMAKGMELQREAQISYENMKEEAADLAYEARMAAEAKAVETAAKEEPAAPEA